MAQPVKLSDDLITDARTVGKGLARSMAGQIELWARIGRAFEPHLNSKQIRNVASKRPLADYIAEAGTPKGDKRLKEHLKKLPFPHYEAAPGKSGLYIQIDAKGRRTTGKFVNRQFQPVGKPNR